MGMFASASALATTATAAPLTRLPHTPRWDVPRVLMLLPLSGKRSGRRFSHRILSCVCVGARRRRNRWSNETLLYVFGAEPPTPVGSA